MLLKYFLAPLILLGGCAGEPKNSKIINYCFSEISLTFASKNLGDGDVLLIDFSATLNEVLFKNHEIPDLAFPEQGRILSPLPCEEKTAKLSLSDVVAQLNMQDELTTDFSLIEEKTYRSKI